MKKIASKFASTCPVCKSKIEVGETVWYDSKAARGSKTVHFACYKPEPVAAKIRESGEVPAPRGSIAFMSADYVWHFDGADALAAPVKASPKNALKLAGLMSDDEGLHGKSWIGFETIAEGVAAFRNGWPAGADRLTDALGSVAPNLEIVSRRRKGVWSDQGDEVDMQRVWGGNLSRSFRRTRRLDRSSPGVVTIAINHSVSWSVDSDQLFWSGAAALRLADQLEAAGHSVEIVVVFSSLRTTENGRSVSVLCTAKEAGAPVDLGALAGICCSGITARTLMFSALCDLHEKLEAGLGQATNNMPAQLADRERLVVAHASRIADAHDAARWVLDTANDLHRGDLREAA